MCRQCKDTMRSDREAPKIRSRFTNVEERVSREQNSSIRHPQFVQVHKIIIVMIERGFDRVAVSN